MIGLYWENSFGKIRRNRTQHIPEVEIEWLKPYIRCKNSIWSCRCWRKNPCICSFGCIRIVNVGWEHDPRKCICCSPCKTTPFHIQTIVYVDTCTKSTHLYRNHQFNIWMASCFLLAFGNLCREIRDICCRRLFWFVQIAGSYF